MSVMALSKLQTGPTLADHATGYLLIAGGFALVAMAMLVPINLEVRDLRWQRDLMSQQSANLAQQQQGYREFSSALAHGDEQLLQRLALTQFRLKPTGSVALTGMADKSGIIPATPGTDSLHSTVESWLHRPLPMLGVDVTPPPRIQSQLVRMTTGPLRPWVLLVGFVAMGFGVAVPRSGGDRDKPTVTD
ncbi:MAG: hypothetical protein GC164_08950 [Phycisphaera sp.]|nr:hypothetical protein [Phycisphaera sp.]